MGIYLILFAYAWFSVVDTSAKWLGMLAYPALQLAFMRYAAHFVISTARVARNGLHWSSFRTESPLLVVVRGFMILSGTVCNFYALKFIPLTLTSTILFSAPVIVCLLSGTMLGEKVGPWRWFAVFLGFIGVLVAIRPFDESFHWAALISLFGATCFSFYLILTRRLAGVVSADTLQFYAGLVGSGTLLPFAILQWKVPATLTEWLLLIGLGVFAWIGHEILTRAYAFADASVLTPYSYAFIVYVTIWSIFIFGEYPDFWTILGAGIIVISGLVIWKRELTIRS